MRIFFVINDDAFFYSHRLPIGLAAKEKGWEVFVLSKNCGKKDELVKLGFNYIDIPFTRSASNPLHELKCTYLISKAIRKYKPDVVHNVTWKGCVWGSLAAKWAGHTRVVNALSGLGYAFTDSRKGVLNRIMQLLLRLSFKSKSFACIFQNPDDLAWFKSKKYCLDGNIYLIKGSGIDLNDYSFTPAPNKERLELLFPARMLKDKGLIELIDACKLLKGKYESRIHLSLVGKCDPANPAGMTEEELKGLLMPGYIDWLGFSSDMKSLYRKSDIVVMPSYREGLPKSLIEACAIGRPIVTTNVPGCKECVDDGYNGFLVPAKESESIAAALETLITNYSLRKRMGENSRKIAERDFSIDDVVKKHFEIYQRLLLYPVLTISELRQAHQPSVEWSKN